MKLQITILIFAAFVSVAVLGQDAFAQNYDYCAMIEGKSVLMLVDRSDKFDGIDREILARGLDKFFNDVSAGDHLSIRTITDDPTTSRIIFDGCVPGCPTQDLLDQMLGKCREVIVRRDRLAFKEDFAFKLKALLDGAEEYRQSAIIETISVLTHEHVSSSVSELIIYSDLIENSRLGNFAHLRALDIAPLLSLVERKDLIAKVPGSVVEIFGFGRMHGRNRVGIAPDERQNLQEFWRLYFSVGGAETVMFGQEYQ